MRASTKTYLPGDTIHLTWVDSGVTLDSSSYNIISGSETILSAGSLTSSGNGHYYADYTVPNTFDGYYVAKIVGVVGGNPYIRAERFKVTELEVD